MANVGDKPSHYVGFGLKHLEGTPGSFLQETLVKDFEFGSERDTPPSGQRAFWGPGFSRPLGADGVSFRALARNQGGTGGAGVSPE